MQLNKMFKATMLIVPMMVMAACSSHKNANDQLSDSLNESVNSNGISGADSGNGTDQQAQLQMQQLRENNIIYFNLDKYDIQQQYADVLDKHAIFLRNNPSFKVTIEGHADERGTPEYNISLGERRANAVKMYLQGKGVSEDQMSIVSYGKEKPAVLGHNEAAWSKNRRAVLVY